MSEFEDDWKDVRVDRTRTYKGLIGSIQGTSSETRSVRVSQAGMTPYNLPLRLDLRRHSPDGFSWGYEGSGPAQLALALCADYLENDERVMRVYQEVKRRIVARFEMENEWELRDQVLRQVIEDTEKARENPVQENP